MNEDWHALSIAPPERRIYLDLDDVLAETTPHIVLELNAAFDRRIAFQELRDFDLGRAFDLDPDQHASAMERVHQSAFLRRLPVRQGSLDVLKGWSRAGYHLAVVTGRPPDAHAVSSDWLRANAVPHHSLHCIDKYGRYPAHPARIPLDQLSDLRFQVAIEDSVEMACFLAEAEHGLVLLMDRPWNRDHPALARGAARRVVRVHTWTEAARAVSSHVASPGHHGGDS